MSVGGILTYGLFVGAILFPQASSDDLGELYSQGNQGIVQRRSQLDLSDIQNYSFLQKFEPRISLPEATHQDVQREKILPQAVSEQNINDSKSGTNSSGLTKKQWYIIGGTIIILLIVALLVVFMCSKHMKKKPMKNLQSVLVKGIQAQQQLSDPIFQLDVDNLQPASILSDVRTTAMEEDPINFQEKFEQNLVTKLTTQEILPRVTKFGEIGREAAQTALVSTIESIENNKTIADVHTIEVPKLNSTTKTMVAINNASSAGGDINVSRDHRQNTEDHTSGATLVYMKDGTHNKDHNVIAKLPRKRYDSESGTNDIDPRIRDHYIRREHDRSYDSDRRRHGYDNASYDHYSEPRIHDHYDISRLETRRADQRFAYDEGRIRYPKRLDIHSTDHPAQHRQEIPRRIEDYGGIDVLHIHRDKDPRKYYPENDDRYSHRPDMIRHNRYQDHDEYYAATHKDSRFKDPFSRDVRHELGAVIANNSFNQNDHLKSFVDAPGRRDIYRAPPKEHVIERERQPMNDGAISVNIPLPKPDYSEEILDSRPYRKPPVVYPKPVVQTVVKPREFKGPYGPEDLDELNNPYTLARGRTQRPAIDSAE